MTPRLFFQRLEGRVTPEAVESRVRCRRLLHFAPSTRVEVRNGQRGPVNHLDLDPFEARFLLAASGDATVGLYDMEAEERVVTTHDDGEAGPRRISSLHVTPRVSVRGPSSRATVEDLLLEARSGAYTNSSSSTAAGTLAPRPPPLPGGHQHSVTAVQWYPLDTGLFVSGSTDGSVRVWDTNTFTNAGIFDLGVKVHALAMSAAMRTHALVAVGTDDRRVRLCDLKSGGSSHLLTGHSEAVTTVVWSPTQEHLLATGSRDSTVRLWDVRRSGTSACLMTLDQHADHRGRTPGLMGGPTELAKAHDGWVVSLDFAPNGSLLLSAGTDKRMRVWNVVTGENTLLNYAGTRNDKPLGWKIKVIQPGPAGSTRTLALYPNGSSGEVLLYPLPGDATSSRRNSSASGSAGRILHHLRGHLDTVQSMVYRREAEQIVTGGADSLILVFDCSRRDAQESQRLDLEEDSGSNHHTRGRRKRPASGHEDAWSSDEEEEEGEGEQKDAGAGAGDQGQGNGGGSVPPILRQLQEEGTRERPRGRRREY